MALLVTPWSPREMYGIAMQWQQLQQRKKEAEMRSAQGMLNAQLAREQRAHEFGLKMEFDRAREFEDRRRWDFENRPFVAPTNNLPPGGTPTSEPPADAGLITSDVPNDPAPSAAPLNVSTDFNVPEMKLEQPEPAKEPMLPSASLPPVPEATPLPSATPVPSQKDPRDTSLTPPLPTDGKTASSGSLPLMNDLDSALGTTASVLQKYGATQKQAGAVLQQVAASVASRRPAESSVTTEIGKWPVNQRGYHFNPSNPAQQFTVRTGTKGQPMYSQVKETDPWYGLTPRGEGLWEDTNGGQYFVNDVKGGKPTLKRVEEDETVEHTFTDRDGRLHHVNRFGREIAISPVETSFLKPNYKLMVGSDGNVYSMDEKGRAAGKPIPQGVTFDSDANRRINKWQVGSDGKMYGFTPQGPAQAIPSGVSFGKLKDPAEVDHYQVDQTSGNLVGFNYRGEKIAENEGDFAKQSARAGSGMSSTMSEQTTYETLAPKVKGLWQVYQKIREAGLPEHAKHEELAALGPIGTLLSEARQNAQKDVNGLTIKGKKVGSDFAEGFVRAYEARQLAQPPATKTAPTTAPTAPTAAPGAAPASTPPAGSAAAPTGAATWKIDKKTGIKWEVGPDGKLTGNYVSPKTAGP